MGNNKAAQVFQSVHRMNGKEESSDARKTF